MRHCWLWSWLLLLPLADTVAQPKKPEKKDEPQVVVVTPLGVPAGKATQITLRGLNLDAATELRFLDPRLAPKAVVKILRKEKSPPPNKQDVNKVGDTQLVADVTLPEGYSAPTLPFVVVTPAGESRPHPLLVDGDMPVIAEKEPNNGFRQAQAIQVPQVIDGAISQPQDVDVFRFEGRAGQHLVCEVLAARYGSALDSVLTLYDSDGRILETNDDSDGRADSRLELVLPKSGVYYLSLIDAHDQGGPAHGYRLVVQAN